MRRTLAITLFLTPALLVPACDQPSRICDLICECEHCNDIIEDYRCQAADASQDIAEVYGCDGEWEAYADCVENEGECNEEEARFSTRAAGSCSGTTDTGFTCMVDADCDQVGINGGTCGANMTCEVRACNDGSGIPCSSDAECTNGEDKCAVESEELARCMHEASDDPVYIGFDLD
jgi:hypothetical protein